MELKFLEFSTKGGMETEFVNPENITHINVRDGGVTIHFINGGQLFVDAEDGRNQWTEIHKQLNLLRVFKTKEA